MNRHDIWLPSNVRTTSSTKNTQSEYITKLPTTLVLDGKWEAGLAEISYTKSWFNIRKKQFVGVQIDINYYEDETLENGQSIRVPGNRLCQTFYNTEFFIGPGQFNDILELVTQINHYLDNFNQADPNIRTSLPRINYNAHTKVISSSSNFVENPSATVVVTPFLGDELCELLGFPSQHIDNKLNSEYFDALSFENVDIGHEYKYSFMIDISEPVKENATPIWQYDMKSGIHALYIYCNIIEPVIVGDTFAQLLRAVEVPSEKNFGDQCVKIYQKIHFQPITSREISTIELSIKDDTNTAIDFRFGRTIAHLILRKVRDGFD